MSVAWLTVDWFHRANRDPVRWTGPRGLLTRLPRRRHVGLGLAWRLRGADVARPRHLGTGGGSATGSPANGCSATAGEGIKGKRGSRGVLCAPNGHLRRRR